MKAAIYENYGKPDVVKIKEIPKPNPAENEILIRVVASTVNRTDAGFRSAEYFISRFWSGLFRPKYKILGCEFSGIVQEIGSAVTQFKIGDEVFGFNDQRFGGHAEYCLANEKDAIVAIPNNLSIENCAALTEGAHYALCNIRAARVKSGQSVLVYGATGAIGSAAVQILKAMNVNVTAVCNSKNIELVKSLGADKTIDYQKEDFSQINEKFHFVFDAVGKSSFGVCKKLLLPKGIYISTELGKNGQNIFLALLTPLFGGRKLLFPIPTISQEDVLYLKLLAEQGKFKPVIDRKYKLEEIVVAYQYVETGQKTGNVLITI